MVRDQNHQYDCFPYGKKNILNTYYINDPPLLHSSKLNTGFSSVVGSQYWFLYIYQKVMEIC